MIINLSVEIILVPGPASVEGHDDPVSDAAHVDEGAEVHARTERAHRAIAPAEVDELGVLARERPPLARGGVGSTAGVGRVEPGVVEPGHPTEPAGTVGD